MIYAKKVILFMTNILTFVMLKENLRLSRTHLDDVSNRHLPPGQIRHP